MLFDSPSSHQKLALDLTPLQLLKTLQLTDSFFPVGAFSYSEGLEAAVDQGWVRNGATLETWMNAWLEQGFVSLEGLALCQLMEAWQSEDWKAFQRFDIELTAMKPAAATRQSSTTLGKRLLRSCLPLYPHQGLEKILEDIESETLHGNALTVYAALFSVLELSPSASLSSIGYTRLTSMISAALRLIAMGQQEGQTILTRQLQKLPEAIEQVLQEPTRPWTSFVPMMDIAQMNHRYLYTRLFRS